MYQNLYATFNMQKSLDISINITVNISVIREGGGGGWRGFVELAPRPQPQPGDHQQDCHGGDYAQRHAGAYL